MEFIRNLRLCNQDFQKSFKDFQTRSDFDDSLMKKLAEEFPRDLNLQLELDGHPINGAKLAAVIPVLILKFKKWIKKMEQKVKNGYLVLDGTKAQFKKSLFQITKNRSPGWHI